ncbi:kinase-like domain-containing protein [Hyaloraphidium curvatum]|nr:kinase-like domain-containing protein [Hyaloraphidium curvatum]
MAPPPSAPWAACPSNCGLAGSSSSSSAGTCVACGDSPSSAWGAPSSAGTAVAAPVPVLFGWAPLAPPPAPPPPPPPPPPPGPTRPPCARRAVPAFHPYARAEHRRPRSFADPRTHAALAWPAAHPAFPSPAWAADPIAPPPPPPELALLGEPAPPPPLPPLPPLPPRRSSASAAPALPHVGAVLPHPPLPAPLSRSKGPRIGQFQLLSPLGRGSYGVVYLGEGPDGGLVAIKRVPLYLADAACKRRPNPHIVSEVAALNLVRGAENVAQLKDVLYTSSHANLVLDYSHGIDVLRFMEARKRRFGAQCTAGAAADAGALPEEFTRLIVHDILKALRSVHSAGIVHRDVKLDNILISPRTGVSSLIDFNLASPMRDPAHPAREVRFRRPAGSLHYCAPDVLRTCLARGADPDADDGDAPDGRGYAACGGWLDVYSLGVACYSMLVGRFPFPGAGAGDILASHAAKGGRCFAGDEGCAVSEAARAFVEGCVDETGRWSAEEALKHAWFEGL